MCWIEIQTTRWIKEICTLWGSKIRWDVRQTSVEGIQDTTHYVFLVYRLQRLSVCFRGVAFFPVSSFSLLPLCIRDWVSSSFIILDRSWGSLSGCHFYFIWCLFSWMLDPVPAPRKRGISCRQKCGLEYQWVPSTILISSYSVLSDWRKLVCVCVYVKVCLCSVWVLFFFFTSSYV